MQRRQDLVGDILLRLEGQPRAFRLEVDLLKWQLYDRLRGLEILIRKLRQFHPRRQHKRAVDRRLGRSELRLARRTQHKGRVYNLGEVDLSWLLASQRPDFLR